MRGRYATEILNSDVLSVPFFSPNIVYFVDEIENQKKNILRPKEIRRTNGQVFYDTVRYQTGGGKVGQIEAVFEDERRRFSIAKQISVD